jgi:radical SAM protein with 4Fe4S-binding SPASM domain
MERIIDDLAASGVLAISLTGGEPLLRKDAIILARRVVRGGMACVVTSNGWFIDEAMAEALAEAGVASLNISLDGPKDKHDAFRGVAGAYEAALGAIRRMVQRGIPVAANFTATEASMDWFFETLSIAAEAGCRSLSIGPCGTLGRATAKARSLVPSWRKWLALVREITDRAKAGELPLPVRGMWTGGWQLYLPLAGRLEDAYSPNLWAKPPEVGPELGTCPAGTYVCAVTPDGCVHPCDTLTAYPEMRAGSLLRASFDDIWQRSRLLNYLRGVSVENIEPCRACRMKAICHGGCRGCTYGATGSLEAPDVRCPIVSAWSSRRERPAWPRPPVLSPGESDLLPPSAVVAGSEASWPVGVGREELVLFGAKRSFIKYRRIVLAKIPGPGVNVVRLNHTAYRLLAGVASGAGPSAIAARLSTLAGVSPETVLGDLERVLPEVAGHLGLGAQAVRDYLDQDPDRLPAILTREVGDRHLVYSSASGQVTVLNSTAAFMLKSAVAGMDAEATALAVAEAYQAPLAEIRLDVEAFWPEARKLGGLAEGGEKGERRP